MIQPAEKRESNSALKEKERRQQTIIGIVVVLVIIAMITGIIITTYSAQNADTKNKIEKTIKAKKSLKAIKTAEKPKNMNNYGGIAISKNGYNNPVKGVPTIAVYFDPMCPGCANFNQNIDPYLVQMMEAGQINMEIYPMSFLDPLSTDHYSSRVTGGIYYIADNSNDPKSLLKFISNIFDKDFQPDEGDRYTPVSNKTLAEKAISSGIKKEVAENAFQRHYIKWQKTMNTATPDRKELWNISGSNAGSMTTPTVTINGHIFDMSKVNANNLNILNEILKSIGLDEKDLGSTTVRPKLDDKGTPAAI